MFTTLENTNKHMHEYIGTLRELVNHTKFIKKTNRLLKKYRPLNEKPLVIKTTKFAMKIKMVILELLDDVSFLDDILPKCLSRSHISCKFSGKIFMKHSDHTFLQHKVVEIIKALLTINKYRIIDTYQKMDMEKLKNIEFENSLFLNIIEIEREKNEELTEQIKSLNKKIKN